MERGFIKNESTGEIMELGLRYSFWNVYLIPISTFFIAWFLKGLAIGIIINIISSTVSVVTLYINGETEMKYSKLLSAINILYFILTIIILIK